MARPRRPVLVAALTVAALAACTNQSHVDRNATVHVTGHALGTTGAALADRPVKLGSGVPGGDAAIGVFTFGLACTSGICAGTVKTAKTDTSGAYDIALKGAETQSTFGEAKSELLSVSAAPTGEQISGATASARFRIQTTKVALPDLTLVDPRTSLATTGTDVAVHWTTTGPPADTVTFSARDGQEVWAAPVSGTAAQLDGRVLEGTSGRVTLSGGSSDKIQGSDVTLRWTGPGIAYASGVGAPASRGAACTYTNGPSPVPQTSGTCALTDGNLTTPVPLPPVCAAGTAQGSTAVLPCPQANAVDVTLAALVPAQLVVVRGCSAACTVSTSADGRTFRPTGSVTGPYGAVALAAGTVKVVRVSNPAGLREISVWGPAKAPPLRPVTSSDTEQLRSPFVASKGTQHRGALISVAAVLLGLVLLAFVFELGRRRRT